MTVRKIIELVNFIEELIGKDGLLGTVQDQIVTIQGNSSNLILLKEITEDLIIEFETLEEDEIPDMLSKVLVENIVPFTEKDFHQELIDLEKMNYPDTGSLYNTLINILTQIQVSITENVVELNKIKKTVEPFLTKDFSILQEDNNAIFAIVFNNINSYNNLKSLSFELKNWDRGLFIYQQIISDETPKPFEIIEVDQGSVEVVLNLIFEVANKLLDLFNTGIEVYGGYLAYKTLVLENLLKIYKGNPELLKSEEEREKVLLENVRKAVKDELKKQSKKKKKHEALDKKIEEVTNLITEHIIKGNSVKLLSAPPEEQEILKKEEQKEEFYLKSKLDYKKLDEQTKQLLLDKFTTNPPEDQLE